MRAAFHNEPETDFAVSENQERMRQALSEVRERLGETVPIVIGGKREDSAHTWERPDPSDTARMASRASFATAEQAERAVRAAHEAFAGWRDTPAEERAALLRRVAEEFGRRRFEIAAWQVYEVGKPWREADADVAEAMDFCRFYADEMERLAAPRKRNVPGEWNEYFYEPRGPAVIIAPWNFPLAILTGMAAAALVAGNPVVLKPSEQSTRVGYFLMEALEAAGVPPGVANFLPGEGETVGPVLVNDPRVALIAFTGSKAVGLSILRDAAEVRPGQREIKRVIAELGGKNAIVVDEDADLDEAVLGVLASAVGYAGQKCSACSRVIVVGSAYEPFCARLSEAIKSIRIGPAEDPATTLGPVVDRDAQERILRYGEVGKQEGRLIGQVDPPGGMAGYYVPALVFADCPPDGKLCQEEIFGPVLAVLRARDLTDALALAEDTQYALTGGLYSRSPENIARVRREFRVGNLYINRKITGALVDRQPFGGARLSGVGSKAGGPDYLLQFLVPRTITESVMRRGFAPSEEM
uniref:L-glutamate gamma-semialdehyde dehydrogenase n=1 Tax=uncultured Armatimonadetes bacterium TaxID=157466 RepID=A0A6J4IQZ5_9BACT|nr:Proline dehydrogenase / Delta-1-pyrroline-5-carboxylate dehydrogenase [uncultured Armatimonadetes bacterium]